METRTALITCVDRYMGGAIKTKFEALGIKVIGSNYPLESQDAIEKLVSEAGKLDIIVANFAEPPMTGPVQAIDNSNWQKLFAALVDPLMYLVRAATPGMLEQKSGKIIAITSAAPLKGIPNNAAYCAARGAQNGFIKAVGLEL
ncbi:MAG: 2-keto-3-deoxy-L-fuconate dehydrogenase, partial [Pseudohongiellaceae bacterium]